jgi:hypothetical protein
VVCVVELVECRFLLSSDAKAACAKRFTLAELDGLYAWLLRAPKRRKPMPVKGQLGIFPIPASLVVPD